MDREIKFRAWVDGDPVGSYVTPSDSFSLMLNDTGATLIMFSSDGIVDEVPVLSVDQYTGLKDKNGVEIYEGDIVTAHQFLFDGAEIESQILGAIGSNCFGWTLSRIKNKEFEIHTGYGALEGECNLGDMYGLHEESWEVIGNIHENPELLEAKS